MLLFKLLTYVCTKIVFIFVVLIHLSRLHSSLASALFCNIKLLLLP